MAASSVAPIWIIQPRGPPAVASASSPWLGSLGLERAASCVVCAGAGDGWRRRSSFAEPCGRSGGLTSALARASRSAVLFADAAATAAAIGRGRIGRMCGAGAAVCGRRGDAEPRRRRLRRRCRLPRSTARDPVAATREARALRGARTGYRSRTRALGVGAASATVVAVRAVEASAIWSSIRFSMIRSRAPRCVRPSRRRPASGRRDARRSGD